MRYSRLLSIILSLFMITAILSTCSITAFALPDGFTTESVSADLQKNIIDYIEISLIPVEGEKRAIVCFDVNENGLLAIGSEDYEQKYICIYKDGEFQYGYTFYDMSSYNIEWKGDNIMIYTDRGNTAIELDPAGKIVSICEIQETNDNYSYWRKLRSPKRNVGGKTYYATNNMGHFLNAASADYSLIVEVDADGNKTVLYDVSEAQYKKYKTNVIGMVILLAFIITVIVFYVISMKGSEENHMFEDYLEYLKSKKSKK